MYFMHSKKLSRRQSLELKRKKSTAHAPRGRRYAAVFGDLSLKKREIFFLNPFLSDYISRGVRYNGELTPSPSSGSHLMNEFRRARRGLAK